MEEFCDSLVGVIMSYFVAKRVGYSVSMRAIYLWILFLEFGIGIYFVEKWCYFKPLSQSSSFTERNGSSSRKMLIYSTWRMLVNGSGMKRSFFMHLNNATYLTRLMKSILPQVAFSFQKVKFCHPELTENRQLRKDAFQWMWRWMINRNIWFFQNEILGPVFHLSLGCSSCNFANPTGKGCNTWKI